MFTETVKKLLHAALTEKPNLFVVDFNISPTNEIKISIDGDTGVTVDDCIFVSRAIEHNLDREEQDFALEVASAGATSPLTHKRQYKKNINRKLAVQTAQNKIEGTLTAVTDKDITLQWKAREQKPVGKGKVTVAKQANIAYENIVEAKVMIKF